MSLLFALGLASLAWVAPACRIVEYFDDAVTCVKDTTWGCGEDHIWVADNCKAKFELFGKIVTCESTGPKNWCEVRNDAPPPPTFAPVRASDEYPSGHLPSQCDCDWASANLCGATNPGKWDVCWQDCCCDKHVECPVDYTKDGCYTTGTDTKGTIVDFNWVKDVFECQEKCSAKEACQFFTYFEPKLCYLKSTIMGATPERTENAISGPKFCLPTGNEPGLIVNGNGGRPPWFGPHGPHGPPPGWVPTQANGGYWNGVYWGGWFGGPMWNGVHTNHGQAVTVMKGVAINNGEAAYNENYSTRRRLETNED